SSTLSSVSSVHSPRRKVVSVMSVGLFVSPRRMERALLKPRNSRCWPSQTGSRYWYSVTYCRFPCPATFRLSLSVTRFTTCVTIGIFELHWVDYGSSPGVHLPPNDSDASIPAALVLYSRSVDLPRPFSTRVRIPGRTP